MQFDRAAELGALRSGILQSQQRKRVGGKIGLRHRRPAAVHDAAMRPVFDRRTIGIASPTATRRHDVAVRVERDRGAVAKAVTHDEIGRTLHTGGLNDRRRHIVRFNLETKRFKQRPCPRRMRRAVAGRIVARDFDELGEERHFALELPIDELKDNVSRHERSSIRRGERWQQGRRRLRSRSPADYG